MPAPPTHSLLCHPASPCAAVQAIEATATPNDGGLSLRYLVRCAPSAIRLPEPRPAQATDGLWQHTCCEAFIGDPAHDGEYREFNFSPSGEWAAYRFLGYRKRDTGFAATHGPQITLQQRPDGFELVAMLAPALLPASPDWQIGLSVVIETADGSKSYWALKHCAVQPDFHLRRSFSLLLKAARS